MWQLLGQAAKSATANATDYVSTVQAKAQSIVATVQEEAVTLLNAMGSARPGPVDEILFEELEDYEAFLNHFQIDQETEEITKILAENEAVKELHEELVPVELSYEEFWRRYLFRQHQELERQRVEEERAQYQREQLEGKTETLDEFEDEEEEETTDVNGQAPGLEDAEALDTVEDKSLEELARGETAQWQRKAKHLQRQLGMAAAKHAKEVQTLKQDSERQYQSLCDSYEVKMTEVTLQIDEARATGYNAGILESESIVETVRQEADAEIQRLKMALAQYEQQSQAPAPQPVDAVATEMLKKEMELWRIRALKMKKAKEAIDAELQALKQQQQSVPASVPSATEGSEDAQGLRTTIADLEQQISSLTEQVATSFANGSREAEGNAAALVQALTDRLAESNSAMTALKESTGDAPTDQLAQRIKALEREIIKSYDAGASRARSASKTEIDELTSELTALSTVKSLQASSLDILADADAVLASLSPTAISAATEGATDWGEW